MLYFLKANSVFFVLAKKRSSY